MNHTPEPQYAHRQPAPVKVCVWCKNSHMADARECICPDPCGQGWCLADIDSSDPFRPVIL